MADPAPQSVGAMEGQRLEEIKGLSCSLVASLWRSCVMSADSEKDSGQRLHEEVHPNPDPYPQLNHYPDLIPSPGS